jgi:hypothetical protein
MNAFTIDQLPTNVQDEVRRTLTAYDEAIVERRNGSFTSVGGHCLDASSKPTDFAVFRFVKDDVYTKEEQARHYKELSNGFTEMNVPDSFWN